MVKWLALLFLIGCASDRGPGYVPQAELEPYYASFEYEGRTRGADVSRATYTYNVAINAEGWPHGEYQRRAVVFNRLGASVLGRPYNDHKDISGPSSLMHSRIYEYKNEVVERNWMELLRELFE
jgi:hypothetical protein